MGKWDYLFEEATEMDWNDETVMNKYNTCMLYNVWAKKLQEIINWLFTTSKWTEKNWFLSNPLEVDGIFAEN